MGAHVKGDSGGKGDGAGGCMFLVCVLWLFVLFFAAIKHIKSLEARVAAIEAKESGR